MISLHPQGDMVSFPCGESKLTLETVRTIYPQATGLKHLRNGLWEVVPMEACTFSLPPDVTTCTVVSGAIGHAREIWSSRSFASRIANTFRTTDPIGFQQRSNSAAQTKKLCASSKKAKNLSRTYKVVFVEETSLPTQYCKQSIVMEGLLDILGQDSEEDIVGKLQEILKHSEKTINTQSVIPVILSYNNKKLSMPQCVPGYKWNGQQMKALVGQGKLYVMLMGYKVNLDVRCDISEDELPLLPVLETGGLVVGESTKLDQDTDKIIQETHSEGPVVTNRGLGTSSTGTPTVTFHPRHQRPGRLSLGRRGTNCSPYSSYVELIDQIPCVVVDSSDDEEVSQSHIDVPVSSGERKLYDLIQDLQQKLNRNDNQGSTKINVTRANPLDGTRRSVRRSSFNPTATLSVRFADDFGTSEGAVDEGGPTRELFRLLLKQISELSVFIGTDTSGKALVMDASALNDGLYKDVGTILAMAVVHCGQFPAFMTETTYHSLVKDEISLSVADIPDNDIRATIQQLIEASSLEKVQSLMAENSMLFELAGCLRPVSAFSVRDKLVDDMLRFLVIIRNLPAIHQLTEGLQTFGLLDMMKGNVSQFQEVFCPRESPPITADQMEAVYQQIQYSENGSNHRRDEERTISYWRDYLIDIEDGNVGVSFEELLVFGTGTDKVPYFGFSQDPSIEFLHESDHHKFPEANTCSMILRLPIVKTYEEFKENMDFGILNSPGFGMA